MEGFRGLAIPMRLAQKLINDFRTAYVERFPRTRNSHANALAILASAVDSKLKRIIEVELLPKPSIETRGQIICDIETELGVSWMDPIIDYLKDGTQPNDSAAAFRVRAQASRYWLSLEQKLYKRSFSGPYLRCVHPKLVQNVLFKLHEGSCGSYTGGILLTHRARTQGYWWPYMQKDVVEYTRKCEQ